MSTVTEFGCIPVSTVYHTDQFGWVVTRLVHIKFSTVKKIKKNKNHFIEQKGQSEIFAAKSSLCYCLSVL